MSIEYNESKIGSDASGIPTITLKQLKECLSVISTEYEDCPVVFSYVHEDNGENFIMGTVAIKFPVVHPDKTYVCLMDGNSGKKFLEMYQQGKCKGKFIDKEENGNENNDPQ